MKSPLNFKNTESVHILKEAEKILIRRGKPIIDEVKKEVLSEKFLDKKLSRALRYFMSRWNDMVRPTLVWLACEAVNGEPENTVPIAKALTLISACSEVHDDLIDKTRVKQKRLTVLGKFGLETAVLVGDVLMLKGLTALHELGKKIPKTKVFMVRDIIKGLFLELADAEALELKFVGSLKIRPQTYINILTKKAADIEACTHTGALLGKGSKKEVEALKTYGRCLGVLSLVKDEIADTIKPSLLLQRVKNEVLPLPVIYTLKKKPKGLTKMLSNPRRESTHEMVKIVYESGGFDEVEKVMRKLAAKTFDVLKCLQPCEARSHLEVLLKAVIPPQT